MAQANDARVIILGSGISGLFVALEARKLGPVLVLTKGSIDDCNTRWAQGGIAAAIGPLDAPGWARIPLQGVRRWLAWRFTRLYTRTNPIPMERIRYYEALRCYHAMHRVAAARLDVTEGRPPFNDTYAWRLPEQVAAMTRLFERNTGVRLILPPAAGA